MNLPIDAETRLLQRDIATLRLELALLRFRYKAYNPHQPRVPAGNPDGGQWMGGGAGAGRIRLAGPLPPGVGHNQGPPLDELSPLPQERPPDRETRSAAVKEAARRLLRYGGPLGRIVGAAYWLYQYDKLIEASLDPSKSLEELQQAVSDAPRLGYQRHHIVEQDAAEKDGYRRSLIDGRDNLVLIPTLKHREITSWSDEEPRFRMAEASRLPSRKDLG